MINPYGEIICKVPEGSVAVVKIKMGLQVTTCFSGNASKPDDTKNYLLKLRNTAAYGPLLDKSENLSEWQDILS
jgi:hypothetical protein